MWQELRSMYTVSQNDRDTRDMLHDHDWNSTYMTTWNVPVARTVAMRGEASDESVPGGGIFNVTANWVARQIFSTKNILYDDKF
jgi:hypothetical protein